MIRHKLHLKMQPRVWAVPNDERIRPSKIESIILTEAGRQMELELQAAGRTWQTSDLVKVFITFGRLSNIIRIAYHTPIIIVRLGAS